MMAHERTRHAMAVLKQLSAFSPILGLLGHRQVGKTTLLNQYSTDYLSLDDIDERERLNENPKRYVASLKAKNTVIDESQLCPELFPALKEHVRKHPKPGQFALSGSIRFTSRKAIQESLTGRIQLIELLPMTISEIEREPLSDRTTNLLQSKNLEHTLEGFRISSSVMTQRQKAIENYLVKGGLPGTCFIRDEAIRRNKLMDQLMTILDRDLRMVYPTKVAYTGLLEFLRLIAITQGKPFKFQTIKKELGLAPNTQKQLIHAFESVFLLRTLPIKGEGRAFSVLFEDQGEAQLLAHNMLDPQTQLAQLLYRNIRAEFFYRLKKTTHFFQYRTRSGVEIPLVIEHDQSVLGILPIGALEPSNAEHAAAISLFRTYANSKIIFVHSKISQPAAINDRMGIISAAALV